MAVVVDDGTKKPKTVYNIIQFLKTKYALTHQPKPTEFVKLKITYHKNNDISISQKGYTNKILKTHNMHDCNGAKTPAEDRTKLKPTTITEKSYLCEDKKLPPEKDRTHNVRKSPAKKIERCKTQT